MFQKINHNLKLTGDRIELFPISLIYLHDFHEYSIISELYTYLEFSPFKSLNESREYLMKLMSRSSQPTAQYFYIYEKSIKKVIGTIGVFDIHENRLSAEIGYGISPKYWRKNYFKETLTLFIDHLFNEISLNRIVAKTSATNIASIRALKKFGFKTEGQMREFYRIDNKLVDATLLSILKIEFIANKTKQLAV